MDGFVYHVNMIYFSKDFTTHRFLVCRIERRSARKFRSDNCIMTMMPVVGGLSALKIDQGKSSIENRMQVFIFFKVRQTLNPSRHEAIDTLGNIISSMDLYKMFTIDCFSRISEVIIALLVLHRKGAREISGIANCNSDLHFFPKWWWWKPRR